MSKTPLRSLKAIAVVAGLVIAQGAVLSQQSSPVRAANVGTNIQLYNNVYQSTAGTATTLTVVGSGFAANSFVNVIFNAAVGYNNSVAGVHATPPLSANPPWIAPIDTPATPGINGDVIETPPVLGIAPTGPITQTNSIAVLAKADGNGNLIGTVAQTCAPAVAPCPGAPAIIPVPANAAPGRYAITATDNSSSNNTATTAYTLTPNSTPGLSVASAAQSLYNGSTLGGSLNINIANGSEAANAVVQFALDDFLASHTGGAAFTGGPAATGPTFTQLGAAVPLKVLSCGGSTSVDPGPTFVTLPAFVTTGTTGCVASAAGGLTAQVQLKTDNGGATGIQTLSATSPAPLAFPDGVYTLVALSDQQQVAPVAPATTVTYTAPGALTHLYAGVQLDHTAARISLSSSQSAPGGSVSVRGLGFAANSTVQVIFGAQQAPIQGTGSPKFPTTAGCAFSLTDATFNGHYTAGALDTGAHVPNCLLTTVATDSTGSFNATVTLPGSTIATTAPGVILAEDFDQPSGAPGTLVAGAVHLNASAIAALGMTSTTTTATLQLSPNPAAVGSTVTFTGTGYTPFESVTLSISDSATGCVATNVATVQAGAALTSGGVANVAGSFIVPTNACTAVATAAGTKNAGITTTVTATGAQSGLITSNSLVIPPTAAAITLAPPPPATATTAVLTGTGFAANEPVSFSFGAADPFTGGASSLTVVVGQSDGNGNVTVNTPLPTGASSGLYSVTATGLNSGFTVTGLQNVVSSGILTVTPSTVLAGQTFVVNGSGFSNTGLNSLFSPQNGTGTLSVNFAPTPVAATQVAITTAGTFVFTGTVPLGTTPGTYTVQVSANVSGGASQVRTATITVSAGITPTLVITSGTTVRIGDTIPISATNFGASEPLTAELDYPATSPLSGTVVPGTLQPLGNASSTGSFTGTYTLSSSLPTLVPGQYNLVVRGTQTKLAASVLLTVNSASTSASGVTSIYFPEGFTGTTAGGSNANFSETLALLNANNYTTTYTVTYFIVGSTTPIVETGVITADSVITRTVNSDVPANSQVAAEVSSPAPLAAERTIYRTDATGAMLDASSSLGEQLDTVSAVPTGGENYLFASSDVQLTNEEYLTMLNPTATAATVTISILPETSISATTVPTIAPIVVTVPAMSRFTEPIRKALIASGLTHYGMSINSTQPVAIERVEYYGDGIGSGKYGASTKPAIAGMGFRQYLFGADYGTAPTSGGTAGVGTGSDLSEVDLINPGPAAAGSATVTVAFFDASGNAINSQQVQVDGQTRDTVNVNDVVGTQGNVFSVVVTSDKNILAELPVSFGGDPSKGGKFAVANPNGAAAGLTSVAFPNLSLTAYGSTAAISQTVNLYNPGAAPISVRGIYVSGSKTVVKTYTVAANSITAVNVNTDAASIAAGSPVGGIFQIVQNGSGTGNSFVASLTTNTPNYGVVTIDQGTYPTSAATGF